jgi:outer membrane protein
MPLRNLLLRHVLLACACLPAAVAHAAEPGRPGPWQLGVGAIALNQPYAGMDSEVQAFPVIGYFGERLQVLGPRATYLLAGDGTLSLRAEALVRFSSYEPEDSPVLAGMEEREMTLDAGLTAGAEGKWGTLELGVLTDTLDRHSGQEVRLSYGYDFSGESLTVTPFAGLRWMSGDLSDYYYGVRPEEATAARPAYDLSSTLSPFAGASARYLLTERWSLFGLLVLQRLDDEVEESPIVGDDAASAVMIALTRSF